LRRTKGFCSPSSFFRLKGIHIWIPPYDATTLHILFEQELHLFE